MKTLLLLLQPSTFWHECIMNCLYCQGNSVASHCDLTSYLHIAGLFSHYILNEALGESNLFSTEPLICVWHAYDISLKGQLLLYACLSCHVPQETTSWTHYLHLASLRLGIPKCYWLLKLQLLYSLWKFYFKDFFVLLWFYMVVTLFEYIFYAYKWLFCQLHVDSGLFHS